MIAQLFLSAAELIAVLNAGRVRPDPRLPQKRVIVMRSELLALPADRRYLLHQGQVYRVPVSATGAPEAALPEEWRVPVRIPTEPGRQLLLRERADPRGRLERELLTAHWLSGAPLPQGSALRVVPPPGDDAPAALYLTVAALGLRRLSHLSGGDLALAGMLGEAQPVDAPMLRSVRGALVSGLTGAPVRSGAWVWVLSWSSVTAARQGEVIGRQLDALVSGIRDFDARIAAFQLDVQALSGQRRRLATECAALLRTNALGARTVQEYRVSRGGVTAEKLAQDAGKKR